MSGQKNRERRVNGAASCRPPTTADVCSWPVEEGAAVNAVDETARQRIRETVIANVSQYERDGKVRVPGVARCIVGTK